MTCWSLLNPLMYLCFYTFHKRWIWCKKSYFRNYFTRQEGTTSAVAVSSFVSTLFTICMIGNGFGDSHFGTTSPGSSKSVVFKFALELSFFLSFTFMSLQHRLKPKSSGGFSTGPAVWIRRRIRIVVCRKKCTFNAPFWVKVWSQTSQNAV